MGSFRKLIEDTLFVLLIAGLVLATIAVVARFRNCDGPRLDHRPHSERARAQPDRNYLTHADRRRR